MGFEAFWESDSSARVTCLLIAAIGCIFSRRLSKSSRKTILFTIVSVRLKLYAGARTIDW